MKSQLREKNGLTGEIQWHCWEVLKAHWIFVIVSSSDQSDSKYGCDLSNHIHLFRKQAGHWV